MSVQSPLTDFVFPQTYGIRPQSRRLLDRRRVSGAGNACPHQARVSRRGDLCLARASTGKHGWGFSCPPSHFAQHRHGAERGVAGHSSRTLHGGHAVAGRRRRGPHRDRVFLSGRFVHCGPPLPAQATEIENPKLLIEVLSPSTEEFDRTEKFAVYGTIANLEELVFVNSHPPYGIEVYRRGGGRVTRPHRIRRCEIAVGKRRRHYDARGRVSRSVRWL